MPGETPSNIRPRILTLTFLLGAMVGIGAYLVVKAVQQQNYALTAVFLVLVLGAVPLVKELMRLRQQLRADE